MLIAIVVLLSLLVLVKIVDFFLNYVRAKTEDLVLIELRKYNSIFLNILNKRR